MPQEAICLSTPSCNSHLCASVSLESVRGYKWTRTVDSWGPGGLFLVKIMSRRVCLLIAVFISSCSLLSDTPSHSCAQFICSAVDGLLCHFSFSLLQRCCKHCARALRRQLFLSVSSGCGIVNGCLTCWLYSCPGAFPRQYSCR